MVKLRDYQDECIHTILQDKTNDPMLMSLATGLGKTIVFSKLATSCEGRVLITVGNKELREQTIEKLKMIDPDVSVGSVQASLNEFDHKITVATRQSLTHKSSKRIQEIMKHGKIQYLIVDEVHEAVQQTKKVIAQLNNTVKVIGFTATPFNSQLRDVFKQINFNKDIMYGIENDYLCEPRAIMVESTTNLNGIKKVNGDFAQGELADRVNNFERNDLIVESYKKYAQDRKAALVFCVNIEHVHSVKEEFLKHGILCEAIDSNTPASDRERIIGDFKKGKIKVVVNCAVLTTGFDYTELDTIILARPTKSLSLFVQIIGRGLRPHDDKEDCLIIDITDNCRNNDVIDISGAFGIQMRNGEKPRQARERIKLEKEAEERRREEIRRAREEAEKKRKEELEIKAREIKLFNRELKTHFSNTQYDWYKVDALSYTLTIHTDIHYVIEQDGDSFNLYKVSTNKDDKYVQYITSKDTITKAREAVEEKLNPNNSFIQKDAQWKKQTPTENQLKWCGWAKTKWEVSTYFASNSIKSLLKKYREEQASLPF